MSIRTEAVLLLLFGILISSNFIKFSIQKDVLGKVQAMNKKLFDANSQTKIE